MNYEEIIIQYFKYNPIERLFEIQQFNSYIDAAILEFEINAILPNTIIQEVR